MAQLGIIIGSIIFLVLGAAGFAFSYIQIAQRVKQPSQRKSNQKLALVVSIMMTFCLWLHWVCAYMHQMNPILKPIPSKGE